VGVNGAARVARFLGWVGSTLQTGRAGVYLGVFVIGAWLLLRALLRS
jgi:hypothetical protein